MVENLASALGSGQLLVGDGAMGSELQFAGLPPGACGELWNVERPDVVEGITIATGRLAAICW